MIRAVEGRRGGAVCFLVVAGGLAGCAGGGTSRPVAPGGAVVDPVAAQAAAIVGDAATERERAVLLYEFVRDEIEFGFTPRFDRASPLYTLERRRGHCNPQTALLVALARAAGIEARHHFVTLSDHVLDGVWPERARRTGFIDHSFAELRIDGRWLRLDGYTLDRALFAGARRRLDEEGRVTGYAAHRHSCREWDGTRDCMAQFVDPAMVAPGGDHGSYADADRFYESAAYRQRMGRLTRLLYRWIGMRVMNRRLDALRAGAIPPAASGGAALGRSGAAGTGEKATRQR